MAPIPPSSTEIDPTIYLSLFATLQAPILFIDEQTAAILDANPAACAFYGYPQSELTCKTMFEISALMPEETRERVSRIDAGEITHMHTRHRLANGEIRDVDVAFGRHNSGERIINIAVINDISRQIQTETALRESEARYRALFENMSEGFALQEIIQDESGRVVDFRFLDANLAYEQHTGQKLEAIIGHTLREVTPKADPAMIERYGKVALTGEPLHFEYHSKTFDRHLRVHSFRPQPNQFATIFEDITERKLTEQALQAAHDELEQRVSERTAELRQSEEKFSRDFYESPVARAIIREAGVVIVDVNDRFAELFKYSREQILGHSPYELGIAPSLATRAEIEKIVLEERRALTDFEISIVLQSGKHLDLLISAAAIELADGKYHLFTFVDITERKRLENELRESEQKYAALFEKSGVPTALVQLPEIAFRKVNAACEELCGYTNEEMFGKTTLELGLEKLQDQVQTFSTFEKQSGLKSHEIQLITKTGRERIVLMTSVPVMINRQPYAISTMVDITERKQAEEKFSKAFYEAPIARAIGRETDRIIIDVNDRFEEMFELSREQVIGRTPLELGLVPGPASLAQFEQVGTVERRDLTNLDVSFVLPSGKRLDLLFSTAAIELVDGKHHMFTFVDITERKRAEEKLAETNIALEKALRAKDEFMAAMSHELRTPLAGILGMVETLDDGVYGSLTDKQVKAVTVIQKNGHRLLDMVNGLIDYTHLQVGDIKPAMGNYSVDEICQSLMKKIEPSVRQKKQHTSIEIDPQVTHIQCDLVWLQKLLWPLVENASKFTPQGGEFGMIVKGNRDEKLVRLSIWDKGIGIQAQDLPRLFQPFVQLDARLSRLYDGTGLGLVLARQIAELLGGSVSVESVFGQGSRFTVTLPWLD